MLQQRESTPLLSLAGDSAARTTRRQRHVLMLVVGLCVAAALLMNHHLSTSGESFQQLQQVPAVVGSEPAAEVADAAHEREGSLTEEEATEAENASEKAEEIVEHLDTALDTLQNLEEESKNEIDEEIKTLHDENREEIHKLEVAELEAVKGDEADAANDPSERLKELVAAAALSKDIAHLQQEEARLTTELEDKQEEAQRESEIEGNELSTDAMKEVSNIEEHPVENGEPEIESDAEVTPEATVGPPSEVEAEDEPVPVVVAEADPAKAVNEQEDADDKQVAAVLAADDDIKAKSAAVEKAAVDSVEDPEGKPVDAATAAAPKKASGGKKSKAAKKSKASSSKKTKASSTKKSKASSSKKTKAAKKTKATKNTKAATKGKKVKVKAAKKAPKKRSPKTAHKKSPKAAAKKQSKKGKGVSKKSSPKKAKASKHKAAPRKRTTKGKKGKKMSDDSHTMLVEEAAGAPEFPPQLEAEDREIEKHAEIQVDTLENKVLADNDLFQSEDLTQQHDVDETLAKQNRNFEHTVRKAEEDVDNLSAGETEKVITDMEGDNDSVEATEANEETAAEENSSQEALDEAGAQEHMAEDINKEISHFDVNVHDAETRASDASGDAIAAQIPQDDRIKVVAPAFYEPQGQDAQQQIAEGKLG